LLAALLAAALSAEPARRSGFQPAKGNVPAAMIRIAGTCCDRGGRPVKDAEIRLYRLEPHCNHYELLKSVSATHKGVFELGEVPDVEGEFSAMGSSYLGVIRAPGLASMQFLVAPDGNGQAAVQIVMSSAGSIRGTVTDERGEPVAGARVYAFPDDFEGVRSALTDRQGRYEIADALPLQAEYFQQGATLRPLARFPLHVSHPRFGTKSVWYWECPAEVDIQFDVPAIVEGQVVGRDGKPAAGICVWLQATKSASLDAPPATAVVATTSKEGQYRFVLQNVGSANLFVSDDCHTASAIEKFEPSDSQTTSVPDLRLVDGGFVAGTVFNKATGRPLAPKSGERIWILAHSTARPRSGAAVDTALVQPDGTYRLRLPEGKCYPYFGGFTSRRNAEWELVSGPSGTPGTLRGIDVKEGETAPLDFTLRIREN
jgi:protocatechuate 3,4-dioxygenase beta subunit